MTFLKNLNFTSGFKKILANTGYLVGEKIINIGLSLVVGIYVARYLGPNDFGLLQYAQSLVALFTAIAGLGTTEVVIRDLISQSSEREGDILGTTFTLMFIGGIFTVVFVIIIGFWLNDESLTQWLVVIASVNLVLQAFHIFDYWFQSNVLSKYSVYARTFGNIIASCLKVLFILLSLSVLYFAFTIIVSGVISSLIWTYNYKKRGKRITDWSFDAKYAKNLLKDSWPLILSGISIAAYMKIDQVMLKNMAGAEAVGNYSVAVRISELWYFIPISIVGSVFPSIITTKKNDKDKYYRRLQYLYNLMAGLAIAIAIPMTFLSDIFITLLFGNEYIQAGNVLAVHIWAGVFVFLGVARSRWIINENIQFFGMIFTISGAIINVALNSWLIPIIGIMGAAWATVISYIVSAWLLAIFFKETRKSFYMLGNALLNGILIIPVLKSLKRIYKEAQI